MAPESASALDLRYYRESHWQTVERERIFADSWQLVGHQAVLAAPGDHVVAQAAGVPILLVRGEDSVLRAFANICRHRAGPLATCDGKGAKRLRCHYHGWLYDLQGRLKLAPEMADALDFDISSIALPEYPLRIWQGLVFVAVGTAPDFEALIDGIAARIAPIDVSQYRFMKRHVYEVACNWKIYIDNYLEGYHVPFVHPGLAQVIDYGGYETEVMRWHSLQHSPIRSDGTYGGDTAYYYWLWPNMMLNIVEGRLQSNVVLPDGMDRCKVIFDYFYADAPDVQARVAADLAITDKIQQEDAAVCEHVQRAILSGAYAPGRLSPKRESGVFHFQSLLRDVYARA